MRSVQVLGSIVALASTAFSQAPASVKSCDTAAGICFSTYTDTTTGISVGISLPDNVTDPYDAVVKIVSPMKNTWAGFSWGGTMTWNPLSVAWPNAKTAVVSSRFAFALGLPSAYDGAEYTLMKGTVTNATHWTMIALCKGCTSWQANDGNLYVLNGTGTAQFAWAQGTSAVQDSSNNASAFNVHASFGKWTHDLNAARSTKFASYVSANLLASAPAPTSVAPTTSATATTLVTSATPKPSTPAGTVPASCAGAGSAVFSSTLAKGWKATKALGGLTSPRSLVIDSKGNMLIVQSGKGITIHTLLADGCVSATKTLVALNSLNHGITLSADSKTLYASSMTTVYSWPYDAAAQTVGTRATVLTGMYNGGAHTTRTLLIGAHAPNLLVVSHGSNDNLDMAAASAKTGRAIVKVFDLTAIPSAGYNYVSQGYNSGYGMRNEIGLTFDGNNMMWGVENSADNFKRTPASGGSGTDIHQNNPAEKLNFIGDITKPNDKWYGYPTCFSVWQASDFTDTKFQVGDNFVLSPNATYKDADCNKQMVSPSLVFMPHSAPIDSKFDATYSNLYVTFHGSWNRAPTTGFKLVVVPFTKGADGQYKPTGGLNTQTGYQDVMINPDVTKCQGNGPSSSSGCFRPSGLVFDAGGRLYMTSDTSTNGELWILGKA